MNILELLKSKISTIYVKYLNNEEIENLPIFYIAGSQKLPPPLSSDEEEELLIKLENKDLEARQILVERNLRLVVYIAKKFENTGVVKDLRARQQYDKPSVLKRLNMEHAIYVQQLRANEE